MVMTRLWMLASALSFLLSCPQLATSMDTGGKADDAGPGDVVDSSSLSKETSRRLARRLETRSRHRDYTNKKKKYAEKQARVFDDHHGSARRMQALDDHGHTLHDDMHCLNLHMMDDHELRSNGTDPHRDFLFLERYLGYQTLVDLQKCTEEGLDGVEFLSSRPKRRLAMSTATRKCRTRFEKCMENYLRVEIEALIGSHNVQLDKRSIANAGNACHHLSSISKEQMRKLRLGDPSLYHHSQAGVKTRAHPVENPTTFDTLFRPDGKRLLRLLQRMFPSQSMHDKQMVHCMLVRLTGIYWHAEYGRDNPHSFVLARTHCHYDIYGFFEREDVINSLEANFGRPLDPPPYVDHPSGKDNLRKLNKKPLRREHYLHEALKIVQHAAAARGEARGFLDGTRGGDSSHAKRK